jgi:hypothetical protein
MTRTQEVKKRLSPIMDRMKASLARIQELEDSLQLGNEEGTSEGTAVALPSVSRSRILLQKSMERLKKKLYTLQRMEEMCYIEEDRRQNLQHYFLQISLSKPCLDMAVTKRHNKELSRDLEIREKDRNSLEAKCATFDELEKRVAVLSEKLKNHEQLQIQLDQTTSQRDQLEMDLVQRQSKINQQAIKIDDLECQVEQLTTVCDDLLKNLREAEARGEKLELDLLESKNTNKGNQRGRSGPPRTIQSKQSSDSDSTKSTEGSTDGTLDTSYPSNPADKDDCAVLDFGKVVSPAKTADTTDSSLVSTFGSACLPEDVGTSAISIFEDDDCSAIVPLDSPDSTVDKLTARIEELRIKNAGLVQSQQESFGKFHALLQENARQAARIQELEQQLPQKKQEEAPASPPEEKQQGRGYFFKRLLKADAHQLKQMIEGGGSTADKAKRISQDLAAHSTPTQ